MPATFFDYLYGRKDRRNPAYAATSPGEVDYNYKGDPSEAIAKYGTTEPLARPSFMHGLLAPDSANNILRTNQAFALAPLEAEQTMKLQEQFAPRKTALDISDLIARGKAQFGLQQEQRPTLFNQQLQETASLDNAQFDRSLSRQPQLLQNKIKEVEALNAIETKAQNEREALRKAEEIKKATTNIAMLRASGALPDELLEYTDETLATMLGSEVSNERLLKEAESRAAIEAELANTKAEMQKRESETRTIDAENKKAELAAKKEAISGNPKALQEIAKNSILGQLLESQTGLPLGAIGRSEFIPRISNEGVTLEKGLVPSEMERTMESLAMLDGKVVTGPDGQPLPKRKPFFGFNPNSPAAPATLSPTNSVPTVPAVPIQAQPEQSGRSIFSMEPSVTTAYDLDKYLRKEDGFMGMLNLANPLSPYNILNMTLGDEGVGAGIIPKLYVHDDPATATSRTHSISKKKKDK